MEISQKKIQCDSINARIDRMGAAIKDFVALVNDKLPKDAQLGNPIVIIDRKEGISYLNDRNTQCKGFDYNIFWSYTFTKKKVAKEEVVNLLQKNAITFVLETNERCYDHTERSWRFFSLYFHGADEKIPAERIDYINDNHDEYRLFCPYELMQIVWRIWTTAGLYRSKISDKEEQFDKILKRPEIKKLEFLPSMAYRRVERELPNEVLEETKRFKKLTYEFAWAVNTYVSEYLAERISINPELFLWMKDPRYFTPNERENSFHLSEGFKMICGYSYFNGSLPSLVGITQNWYSRLLYFSYYVSSDFKTTYYTISMTSCEGRFRKNYMKLIEATSLEELLSEKNRIVVAKWLEEIAIKTALMYEYSSLIEEKKISHFSRSVEIDL